MEIEKLIGTIGVAIIAMIMAFCCGRSKGQDNIRKKQLEVTNIELRKTVKARNNFNNLSDSSKSRWLFNILQKRKHNNK